jgi:hypothetical protein
MPDADGYPTDHELQLIRDWSSDWSDLLTFVRGCWWAAEWGWDDKDDGAEHLWRISTGGWSGNETIIAALQQNEPFWATCWQSTRVGGHYEFVTRSVSRFDGAREGGAG